MSSTRFVIIAAVIALVVAAGVYLLRPGAPPPPPAASEPSPAPPTAPKGPQYPVAPQASAPLPPLAASDPTLIEALGRLLGAEAVSALIVPQDLIRNIVATVDNLPRDHFARRLSPLRSASGLLKVTGADDKLAIAPGNSGRYGAFVAAFTHADPAGVVALYTRL